MRSVFTIIIALLFPCTSIVTSASAQQKLLETSSQHSESQSSKPERESESESKTLDFSGTGRPGQQTAGESRGSCVDASQPIEAMLPKSNAGKTVVAHPRFWVYFPKTVSKNTEIEFVVQNESREDIWRSRFSLNSSTGYQSFSLPETEAPLQVGQWYRWYVKVYCDELVASAQYVQGWVKRVPLDSKLRLELQQDPQQTHIAFGNNRIWYDAIDRLLSSHHRQPKSLTLEKDWQNFVRAKGVQLEGLPSMGGSQICQH